MDGAANLERSDREDVSIATQAPAELRPTSCTGVDSEATSWRWAAAAALLAGHGAVLRRCAERCLAWRRRETDVEPDDLVEEALIRFLDGRWDGRVRRSCCCVRCASSSTT
jgi:hypothetical protein